MLVEQQGGIADDQAQAHAVARATQQALDLGDLRWGIQLQPGEVLIVDFEMRCRQADNRPGCLLLVAPGGE